MSRVRDSLWFLFLLVLVQFLPVDLAYVVSLVRCFVDVEKSMVVRYDGDV